MCFIVFDHMVYPDPKFLISKTKKWPHFFLRLVTVSICNNIEHLSNINEIVCIFKFLAKDREFIMCSFVVPVFFFLQMFNNTLYFQDYENQKT